LTEIKSEKAKFDLCLTSWNAYQKLQNLFPLPMDYGREDEIRIAGTRELKERSYSV
jgi:hypothetical protein